MSGKIMVVDDATFMRMMLKDILNDAGFNSVVEAKSGNEALMLIKSEHPSVVILDVTMPDIDGIEALVKIKEINPKIAVIMCSSMGQESIVSECFDSGADDFIMKPFKPERIVASVSQFIKAE